MTAGVPQLGPFERVALVLRHGWDEVARHEQHGKRIPIHAATRLTALTHRLPASPASPEHEQPSPAASGGVLRVPTQQRQSDPGHQALVCERRFAATLRVAAFDRKGGSSWPTSSRSTRAPSPVVDVVVTSPTGGTLRSTTYRGLLDVSVDTNSGPTLTEGPVQFILPDSLPYPQAQVSSGASLSCSAAPVGFTPIGSDVRTVIAGVAAAFAEDPRNAGAARGPAVGAAPDHEPARVLHDPPRLRGHGDRPARLVSPPAPGDRAAISTLGPPARPAP